MRATKQLLIYTVWTSAHFLLRSLFLSLIVYAHLHRKLYLPVLCKELVHEYYHMKISFYHIVRSTTGASDTLPSNRASSFSTPLHKPHALKNPQANEKWHWWIWLIQGAFTRLTTSWWKWRGNIRRFERMIKTKVLFRITLGKNKDIMTIIREFQENKTRQ